VEDTQIDLRSPPSSSAEWITEATRRWRLSSRRRCGRQGELLGSAPTWIAAYAPAGPGERLLQLMELKLIAKRWAGFAHQPKTNLVLETPDGRTPPSAAAPGLASTLCMAAGVYTKAAPAARPKCWPAASVCMPADKQLETLMEWSPSSPARSPRLHGLTPAQTTGPISAPERGPSVWWV